MSDVYKSYTYSRFLGRTHENIEKDITSTFLTKPLYYKNYPETETENYTLNPKSTKDLNCNSFSIEMKLKPSHSRPAQAKHVSYGTAGFRSHADNLRTFVLYRVGILAGLRSYKHKGQTIGVMITASHNPPQDNGVKIVEPDGSMLTMDWEALAIKLANAEDSQVHDVVNEIIASEKISLSGSCKVIVGYDTRATSEAFSAAVVDGVEAFDSAFCVNFNLLTTPQLHYLVVADNTKNTPFPYGTFSERGYYEKLSGAFEKLMKNKNANKVTVDCDNGVGALKLSEFNTFICKHFRQFHIENGNVKDTSKLNYNSGADFVKVKQKVPTPEKAFSGRNEIFVSFDGDADRIIYFFNDEQGQFHLLDGDKIASLLSKQLNTWLNEAELVKELSLGVVQTAYANGASTNFLKQTVGAKSLACAKTGVKHCHHKATTFDIGVYFEANGHGTIICNKKAMSKINESGHEKLINFINVINQTVGDALSILLAVEVSLVYNNWSIKDWAEMYTDLPNRQVKVKVADRTKIQTFDEERQVSSPENLQNLINLAVESVDIKFGRSFVRPSGTEDVVRVYAEASSKELCDQLARKVAGLVYEHAGGIGGFDEDTLW